MTDMKIPEPPKSSHGPSHHVPADSNLDDALDLLFDPIPGPGVSALDAPPVFLTAVRRRGRAILIGRVVSTLGVLAIAVTAIWFLAKDPDKRAVTDPQVVLTDPIDSLVQGRGFRPGPSTTLLVGGGRRHRGGSFAIDPAELEQMRPGTRIESERVQSWLAGT